MEVGMNLSDFSKVEMQIPWPKRDGEGRVVSTINYAEFVRVRRHKEEDVEKIPAIGETVLCRLDGVECEMRVKSYEFGKDNSMRIKAESVAEGAQIIKA